MKLLFENRNHKKSLVIIGFIISVLLLSVFSCTPNSPTVTSTTTVTSTITTTHEVTQTPPVMETNVLYFSQWILVSLNGSPPVEGSNISLYFCDGSVGGFSGINTYGAGKYLVNAENMTISFPTLTSTQLGSSSNALTEQEKAYYSALSKTVRFSINGNRFEFYDQSDQAILVFEEVSENQLALSCYPIITSTIVITSTTTVTKQPLTSG